MGELSCWKMSGKCLLKKFHLACFLNFGRNDFNICSCIVLHYYTTLTTDYGFNDVFPLLHHESYNLINLIYSNWHAFRLKKGFCTIRSSVNYDCEQNQRRHLLWEPFFFDEFFKKWHTLSNFEIYFVLFSCCHMPTFCPFLRLLS